MKTLRALACTALIAAAASPALAGDLMFHAEDGEAILSNFDGRPYWELQAFCAGFHGASANYFDRKGQGDKAKAHETSGVSALNDAVRQLRRDRGVSAADATSIAEPVLTLGGRKTAEALRNDGTVSNGRWNYWRSFCIDAKAAFVRSAR
jgi:hypothetical protein